MLSAWRCRGNLCAEIIGANMYASLLIAHALLRWLVLATLLWSIGLAYTGYFRGRRFSSLDNGVRHWTATVAHIQLIVGIILYIKSPVVKLFWSNAAEAVRYMDALFFDVIHFALMLAAVTLLTIGSAVAKRKPTDKEKFRTMLLWFSLTLLLIFIAIPWPFSPLANRPLIRGL